MVRPAAIALLAFAAVAPAGALEPGAILVVGEDREGATPSPCHHRVCRVDFAGTPTVLSDELPVPPPTPEWAKSFALLVESPDTVLVLAESYPAPGTLHRVALDTGAVTTIATGLVFNSADLALTRDGRLFSDQPAGIVEIDTSTGALTTRVAGTFKGVAAEPGGTLLSMRMGYFEAINFPEPELVRIDPDAGTVTPLGSYVLAIGGLFQLGQILLDGSAALSFWGSTDSADGCVLEFAVPTPVRRGCSEVLQTNFGGLARDIDGSLLIGRSDLNFDLYDLVRLDGDTFAIEEYRGLGFAVVGIGVVPLSECGNGLDDDGDGLTDHGAGNDPGCNGPDWNTESPACDDGIDNDGDGAVDWDGGPGAGPADAQCTTGWRRRERPGCGLGFELALVAPLLARLRGAKRLGRR
jgi:hypothetical protein